MTKEVQEHINQLYENDRITKEAVEEIARIMEQKFNELAHEVTKDRMYIINQFGNPAHYERFSEDFDAINKQE